MIKATLIKKIKESDDVTTFVWKPEQHVDFTPGQFIHYKLEHPHADPRGEKRYFSISSAPHEDRICITTRITEFTGSSFKKKLNELNIGDHIEMSKPGGSFTIKDPTKNYIFIAGGIGITPFRSILKDLDKRNESINVFLIYGNRDQNIIFKDELEDIAKRKPGLRITYVVRPDQIDGELISKTVQNLKDYLIYVSGPEPFVDKMDEMLLSIGAEKDQIVNDAFPNYTEY